MTEMKPDGSYTTISVLVNIDGCTRDASTCTPRPTEIRREVWTRECGDWPYGSFFDPDTEIACRGTGKIMVDDAAMRGLVRARTRRNVPFILRSAYRSPEHNANTKGAARHSKHMQGCAFDISILNQDPFELIEIMKQEGFPGRGIYIKKNFIHFDTYDRVFEDSIEDLRRALGVSGIIKEEPKATFGGFFGGCISALTKGKP